MLTMAAALTALNIGIMPMLKFETRQVDNKSVLLAYDCGGGDGRDEKRDCEPWESGFKGVGDWTNPSRTRFVYKRRDGGNEDYPGDAARLDQLLRGATYQEVWLLSGGGDLDQGIRFGQTLRRHRIAVRVPSLATLQRSTGRTRFQFGGFCASSCTVAFLGGLFRSVDDGSRFLVHSASSVKNGMSDSLVAQFERGEFRQYVNETQTGECEYAVRLMRHFQNSLLLLTRLPQQQEDTNTLHALQTSICPAPSWYDADAEAKDVARFRLEGQAAGQDIAMRIEREGMRQALAQLRQKMGELGPRARPALAMLDAMYDVTIVGRAPLSPQILLEMGYVSQFVQDGSPK